MFSAVVEVCIISLAELIILCARFVGSMTVHWARTVDTDSNRAHSMMSFLSIVFLLISDFIGSEKFFTPIGVRSAQHGLFGFEQAVFSETEPVMTGTVTDRLRR